MEITYDYPLAPEPIKVDGVEKLISHFKPKKIMFYTTKISNSTSIWGSNSKR